MKRSSGVTASAVIAIIGSVFDIQFGGLTMLSALIIRNMPNLPTPPGQPAPPVLVGAILIAESILFLGFGAWGIASAVGLLRLKNWARVSFLVYAGLLSVFSIFGALFMLLFLMVGLPMPPQQNLPPGFMTGLLAALIFFELMLVALGVWWLFYFNHHDVKAQFMGEAAAALPSRRPLSITIIAWLLITTILSVPLYLFGRGPIFVFGVAIDNWIARKFFCLIPLIGFLAGIGLLRMRSSAQSVAIAYYVFNLVDFAANVLLPGDLERWRAALEHTVPKTPEMQFVLSDQFYWTIMLSGLIATGLPLWFLATRRQAFLHACKAPPTESASGPGDAPKSRSAWLS